VLATYLARLGIDAAGRHPTLDLLTELQVAHLVTVPFENLDVFHRRPVRTSLDWSLPKIVELGRGGWCFELNGAFGWLLQALGFDATYVSCRVHDGNDWGPDLDHCAVAVRLPGGAWFADVGFGDSCMTPVPLCPGEYDRAPRAVRIREESGAYVLEERQRDGRWADQLHIAPAPRAIGDFEPRSTFLRTEPGLPWTAKPFATRATAIDGSRVTLRSGVLRRRTGGGEFEDTTVDPASWSSLLREHFGLDDELEAEPA